MNKFSCRNIFLFISEFFIKVNHTLIKQFLSKNHTLLLLLLIIIIAQQKIVFIFLRRANLVCEIF